MRFLVKVRVDASRLSEFGERLKRGELDRSLITSETYCMATDPAVGVSIWEAEKRERFEEVFTDWKPFYVETEVSEVISPIEAMQLLMKK